MTELNYLALSVLVYFGIIGAQAVFANLAHNPATLLGPRDDFQPTDKYLLRARRALANMTEAMVMFTPLALIVVITEKTSAATGLGAALFFWARLAYAIIYIAGAPVVRSIAWAAGMLGVAIMFWAAAPIW